MAGQLGALPCNFSFIATIVLPEHHWPLLPALLSSPALAPRNRWRKEGFARVSEDG
jgi:hypothetical protein